MQKRVVVTGGASGLGRALALRWAKAGADVVIADINAERGKEVLAELNNLGRQAWYFHCDIRSDDDVQALTERVGNIWPSIDLLINNAGVATAGSLVEEDIEQWAWVLDINVLGAVRMTRAMLPLLKAQQGGYLLNVASQAGITAAPVMASYNASKAAIVSFSETMRLELIDANIGVSVLCPGFFKTNLDESVRSPNPAMKGVVTRLLDKAQVNADDVANCAFDGVQAGRFMLLSHKEGAKAYRIKRWFPQYYFKMMADHTKRLRKMGQ